ncbi:hypothetical protein JOQ06_018282, partial [Pogonophryne albipinna]
MKSNRRSVTTNDLTAGTSEHRERQLQHQKERLIPLRPRPDWSPSGEVTREVLDKCKVLSADTGHHNDTCEEYRDQLRVRQSQSADRAR